MTGMLRRLLALVRHGEPCGADPEAEASAEERGDCLLAVCWRCGGAYVPLGELELLHERVQALEAAAAEQVRGLRDIGQLSDIRSETNSKGVKPCDLTP